VDSKLRFMSELFDKYYDTMSIDYFPWKDALK
jgi:hypothetical protein